MEVWLACEGYALGVRQSWANPCLVSNKYRSIPIVSDAMVTTHPDTYLSVAMTEIYPSG